MRKLICAMLILALLAVPVLVFSVSAESAVDEDVILSDLLPDKVDSSFEATNCEAEVNRDGSITVTITGGDTANPPKLKIKLAEGTLLYTGGDVDLSKDAYVAVDFGTAGDLIVSHMILHYTRKDKDATGTFADLYLDSMYSNDYAQYRKQVDSAGYASDKAFVNGSSHYVVWDWGTYVASSDAKLFDNKMHHFVDIDLEFAKSTVGSQITFYTIAVVSDPEVELGTVTPDPIEPQDPVTSDDSSTSEESTEDPDTSDESSDESAESSVEESSAASSVEESSTATSSTATSSSTTSSTPTSSAGTSSTVEEEGGLSTGAIIGIIVAVVVVIGAVVAVVIVRKKK